MILKRLSFVLALAVLLPALFVAMPVFAGISDPPPGVTPNVCPASVPGCNTPINVGTLMQTKNGPLTILSTLFGLPAWSGSNQPTAALRIGYVGGNGILDIGQSQATGGWIQSSNKIDLATHYPLYLNPNGGGVRVGGTAAPITNAALDVNGQIRIQGGAPGLNRVLISDANGLARWVATSTIMPPMPSAGTNYWKLYNGNIFNDATVSTNVGIGTNVPKVKLDINGQIGIRGGSPGLNKVLVSDANGLASWVATSTIMPPVTPGGTNYWTKNAANNIYNNTTGGKVGIGTDAPVAALTVKTLSNDGIAIEDKTSGKTRISLANLLSGGVLAAFDSTGAMRVKLDSSPTNNSYINTAGNLGIGTDAPIAKLTVNAPKDNANGGILLKDSSSGVPKAALINSTLGGGALALWGSLNNKNVSLESTPNVSSYINNGGNFGIGTNNPTARLDVNGQIKIAGGNPVAGKVLTAVDSTGLATWQNSPSSLPTNCAVGQGLRWNGSNWYCADWPAVTPPQTCRDVVLFDKTSTCKPWGNTVADSEKTPTVAANLNCNFYQSYNSFSSLCGDSCTLHWQTIVRPYWTGNLGRSSSLVFPFSSVLTFTPLDNPQTATVDNDLKNYTAGMINTTINTPIEDKYISRNVGTYFGGEGGYDNALISQYNIINDSTRSSGIGYHFEERTRRNLGDLDYLYINQTGERGISINKVWVTVCN